MTDGSVRDLVERMLDEADRTGWYWQYLPTGKSSHAVRPEHSVASCGIGPLWPDGWRGTGSQAEYERAATMPKCRRCLRRTV